MSEANNIERESILKRTLQDLSDDAFRQNGVLKRSEIDDTFLHRKITPDEAVGIDTALIAEGVKILDDLHTTTFTFDGLTDSNSLHQRGLDYLLKYANNYPLLTAAQERELGYEIQQEIKLTEDERNTSSQIVERVIKRAENAKTKLVLSNIKLVAKMAFDYRYSQRMDSEDLMQFGFLGLLRACEKFDPDWGTKFSTYATWWIRQAITRGLDDGETTIRLPVHMREKISKYRRARRSLGLSIDYSPSDIPKIAESLGWDEAYTGKIAQLTEQKVISYDAPMRGDSEESMRDIFRDENPGPEEMAIANDFVESFQNIIDDLNDDRTSDIVRRRFGIDDSAETLETIGHDYGVTRERIRQIEAKALRRLRQDPRMADLHSMFGIGTE